MTAVATKPRDLAGRPPVGSGDAVAELIGAKLARIRAGEAIRYVDMFAGAGGLSLGFLTAGYVPVASIESDEPAAKTHGANFGRWSAGGDRPAHHAAHDVSCTAAIDLFREFERTGPVDDQIDILVGGPPCQAFARVGRAKLREQAMRRDEITAQRAFLVDGRVDLWRHYVAFIRATRPVALLMENVPDILNHGGTNVAELVATRLADEGYRVAYTLMNAAFHGVPQFRERMIMIGFHEATGIRPRFPTPTHRVDLPSGYLAAANAARRVIRMSGSAHHRWLEPPPRSAAPATTAAEALADLPPLYAQDLLRSGGIRRGARDAAQPTGYATIEPPTPYARLMRGWSGFATRSVTTGHVFRYLPRDYKIFAEIEPGWEYPQIHGYVERKIVAWLSARRARGLSTAPDAPAVRRFVDDWRLPYDPSKFPNKWWKLAADRPVRTLMAHLGKDTYSHIHFDSRQARTISVREAARLQSFPDGFVFPGTMNPAFRQIGNAVPPLLAYAVAMAMREGLGAPKIDDMRVTLLGIPATEISAAEGATNP